MKTNPDFPKLLKHIVNIIIDPQFLIQNSPLDAQIHITNRSVVLTLEPLDQVLVLGRLLRGKLEPLRRDVQHRLTLQLPACVRQVGQKLVQLS